MVFEIENDDGWIMVLCTIFGVILFTIQMGLICLFGWIDPNATNPNAKFVALALNIDGLLTVLLMAYPYIDIAFRDINGKFRWFK